MSAQMRTQGLRELIADLDKAQSAAIDEVRGVVAKGALNIKNDWRRRWSGHPHIPLLPRAINYDIRMERGTGVEAEIGPDKDRPQGPLGNLIEFGTATSAPLPGGLPALEAETPRYERALADLSERLAAGRG